MNTSYSFIELKHWLDGLPNQVDGDPCAVSDIGEPYVAFHFGALARPGDVEVVESVVADYMRNALENYLKDKGGRIYWRTRLEWEIIPYSVIVKMDENGPDKDYVTDRKCVMDKNWRAVRCFCRLVRAQLKTMEVVKGLVIELDEADRPE